MALKVAYLAIRCVEFVQVHAVHEWPRMLWLLASDAPQLYLNQQLHDS